MNIKENTLRAWRFQQPEWIPVASGFPPMCYDEYDPAALEDLMLTHPRIFPGYRKGMIDPKNLSIPPDMFAGRPYTDGWGSVWKTNFTGMVGSVIHHPLADWTAFESFGPPDPERSNGMYPLDWVAERKRAEDCRQGGHLFATGLPHGHTFLRLQDLRGFENLVMDMMMEEERLPRLIRMIEDFNLELIRRFLELRPDVIHIPEDLGMQTSPMISPDLFRRYILPSYRVMMAPIQQAGVIVHEHSDGYILDLIDDLVEAGTTVINLQDLVNGIDNIANHVRGRVAIDLDIDRQHITVHGAPKDIDDHIREIVMKLGRPEGGLSMCYQPWPPTPLENIRAVFDALEKYSTIKR